MSVIHYTCFPHYNHNNWSLDLPAEEFVVWSLDGPVPKLVVEPLPRSQSKSSVLGTLTQVQVPNSKLQSPGGGHALSNNCTSSIAISP